MTDDEMFVEAKRSLSPVFEDRGALPHGEYSIDYRSARRADQHQHRRLEGYIQVGGLVDVP